MLKYKIEKDRNENGPRNKVLEYLVICFLASLFLFIFLKLVIL